MIDLSNFDPIRESQPWWIYEKKLINQETIYFSSEIDYGFWFLLRSIHVKWPERNQANTIWNPDLNMEMYERGANITPQNLPTPFKLFATQNSDGVSPTSGITTATSKKNIKLFNYVFPYRDNIELRIHRSFTPTNTFDCDILLIGYLLPEKSMEMWKERERNG